MNLDSISATLSNVVGAFVKLGISLVLLALVVDVLAPGTTDIVASLAGVVNSFVDEGLAGLVAFIVVVAIITD